MNNRCLLPLVVLRANNVMAGSKDPLDKLYVRSVRMEIKEQDLHVCWVDANNPLNQEYVHLQTTDMT